MLTITRKWGQSILIGDNVEVVITGIDKETGIVRVSIDAPKEVVILRKELKYRQPLKREKFLEDNNGPTEQ